MPLGGYVPFGTTTRGAAGMTTSNERTGDGGTGTEVEKVTILLHMYREKPNKKGMLFAIDFIP
jgi:hypothetical protein